MENNKLIKILGFVFILLVGIGLLIHSVKNIESLTPSSKTKKEIGECKKDATYCIFEYDGEKYYVLNKGYQKEHDIVFYKMNSKPEEFKTYNYKEYAEFCNKNNIKQKYTDKNSYYMIFTYSNDYYDLTDAVLGDVEFDKNNVTLYIYDTSSTYTGFDVYDGSTTGYSIIIPTSNKPTSYKIQALQHRTDYNDIAGLYPLEGYRYTKDDNILLAKEAYINTNNEELNKIINNTFDALAKQHTIKVTTRSNLNKDLEFNSYLDLVNSVFKVQAGTEAIRYYGYADDMKLAYFRFSLYDYGYEADKHYAKRTKMFYDIFSLFGNKFLDSKDYNVTISEDGVHHVLEVTRQNDQTIINGDEKTTYYIFKDTYLIDRVETESSTHYYEYVDDEIRFPDDINKRSFPISVDKPILYLYPEKEMDLQVSLKDSDLIVSYPKYDNGWDIKAYPNGNIYDKKTKKNYYSLYWEANIKKTVSNETGFVVSKDDSVKFLEEKLSYLGLNEREANEFIIYWLPILEKNNYNLIHFLTEEEVNEIVPLEISTVPDTMIRVYIQITPLNEYKEVKEQKLVPKERKGFTSVDWGGILIK